MENRKKDRLLTLSRLNYAAGELTTIPNLASHPIRVPIGKSEHGEAYFIAKEYSLTRTGDSVYHLPFIFDEDGSPWYEANLFFYWQSIDSIVCYKTTEELRRRASMLLDYKVFCEDSGIDYLDFSSPRPGNRPTYRYFQYLIHNDEISVNNLNHRTLVVYDFYKFLAKQPGVNINISRVDSTKKAFITFENGFRKEVELRSQRVKKSNVAKPVPVGYVRDQGENLRPLSNEHSDELIDILNKNFSVDERLIQMIALNTGARKQSIFTLRMKHIRLLTESEIPLDGAVERYQMTISTDGMLMLKAGPSTGIDTKFNKPQVLYFPNKLVEQLKTYASSKEAQKRRDLFRLKHGDILNDDDMYLFLSVNGNCHYMAKNDPRYRQVKSRPKGEHTNYLKKKLFKYASSSFPKSFTFHWQRATFAYKYYQYLIKHVVYDHNVQLKIGQLRPGEEIRKIQQRLHHTDRTTTEHYLKLFINFDEKMAAQNAYEDRLFEGIGL